MHHRSARPNKGVGGVMQARKYWGKEEHVPPVPPPPYMYLLTNDTVESLMSLWLSDSLLSLCLSAVTEVAAVTAPHHYCHRGHWTQDRF